MELLCSGLRVKHLEASFVVLMKENLLLKRLSGFNFQIAFINSDITRGTICQKAEVKPGVLAYTFDRSTWEAKARRVL